MPTLEPIFNGVPIGKLFDKPIYAKRTTYAYDSGHKKVIKTFFSGGLIGNLYSFTVDLNGRVWLVFDNGIYNPNNPSSFWVDANESFDIPDLPQIKSNIKAANDLTRNANKSTLEIYIDKYAPYIIAAIVIAIALPTVLGSVSRTRSKKMGANSANNTLVVLLIGGGVVYALNKKKKRTTSLAFGDYETVPDNSNTNLLQAINGFNTIKKYNMPHTC